MCVGKREAIMQKLVVLLAAVEAVACARGSMEPDTSGSAARLVSVGDTVELKFGETVRIAQSSVLLQFRSVVADSRCPINVVCVWTGDAHVQISVGSDSATKLYDLHTYLDPKVVNHGDYRFRLMQVAPPRHTDDNVRPEDYSIKLEITRAP